MNVAVCIKQVPDTTEVRIDPRTQSLVREGVPAIVNPDDLHAVEEAIRLKDRLGGRVVALTMGPPQAEKSLRRVLSLGADEAVLLSDRAFAAADTFSTTYVLALAIRKLERERGQFDLILCGRQALDGDTGQVGSGLSRRLGVPVLGCVISIRSVNPEGREIVVERRVDRAREVIRSSLPALLTVDPVINRVRYAALPDLLRSVEAQIPVWGVADLGADPHSVGLRGSPTKVLRSFAPAARARDTRFLPGEADNPLQAAAMLADILLGRLAGVRDGRFVPVAVPAGAPRG